MSIKDTCPGAVSDVDCVDPSIVVGPTTIDVLVGGWSLVCLAVDPAMHVGCYTYQGIPRLVPVHWCLGLSPRVVACGNQDILGLVPAQ